MIDFSPRLMPRVAGNSTVKAQDLIQQCADHLTRTIRAHTSSWHMLQKIFVDDLDPARDTAHDPAHTSARDSASNTTRELASEGEPT